MKATQVGGDLPPVRSKYPDPRDGQEHTAIPAVADGSVTELREPPAALAPISYELHEAIDAERSVAYANGADAVWTSLGCGKDGPNEAVFDEAKGFYVVRPKSEGGPALPARTPPTA